MTSCKLLVYYPDDFRVFSGTIQNHEPMQVKIQGINQDDLNTSIRMKLKWYENNTPMCAYVSSISESDDIITFDVISEIQTDSEDSHFIEFREYFEIVTLDDSKIGEFKHRVDQVNNRHKGTLATQIKKILTDETLTNQYLFKLLIQVDSKLDELLDSLKQEEIIDGLINRKLFSLGGDGISFLYDSGNISVGDTVYVQSMPKSGIGINFAALCKVTDTINTQYGTICETTFDYLDESTRETIIHYIFQKDREKLKRTRS